MKTALGGLLAVFGIGVLSAVAVPPGSPVEVSVVKKKVEAEKSNGKGEGSEARKVENASYSITVKNISMGDLPAMTVDYILFVERQKLGEKKTIHPLVQRQTGQLKLDPLPKSAAQTVTTEPVELVAESLVGGYHYDAGGRIKAQDAIVGVWVRANQGEKVIGEYAMPPNITSKGGEDKLKAASQADAPR